MGSARFRRLAFVVCVLTGLVVSLYVDEITRGLPEGYWWVKVIIKVSCILVASAFVTVFIWTDDVDQSSIRTEPRQAEIGYIIHYTEGGNAITCMQCGMTSFNHNDVVNLWCSRCSKFHNTLQVRFWETN